MSDIVLRLRAYPIAVIRSEEVNVYRCLQYLDWKCKNIYLVDRSGRYDGGALTRTEIQAGWKQCEGNYIWQVNPINICSISERIIKEYSREQQKEYFKMILKKFPLQEEFPVVSENGKIVYVVGKQEESIRIDWEKVPFPKELQGEKKIYISSTGSDNLIRFYRKYHRKINAEFLSEKNINDAIKNGLILYEKDGLPECRKINLSKAVRQQEIVEAEIARKATEEAERREKEDKEKKYKKELRKIIPRVHVAKQYAAIKENEFHDMSQLIEKFDEGYFTVSIVDAEDNFKYFIAQDLFKDDFPNKDLRVINNIFVEWQDDEKALKKILAELFLSDEKRKEIPILCNGKIVALGRYTGYFDINENWDSRQAYMYDWNWIDENVAREFFQNRRKILISSQHGYLKGFVERFSAWLDITVYKDEALADCLTGNYDLMLYGAYNYDCFWFRMGKWDAHLIYITLLQETVRRWLAVQGVAFYFFAWDPNPPNVKDRCNNKGEYIGGIKGGLREGAVPYFVVDGNDYDKVVKKEELLPNFHSGCRVVSEAKNYKGNGIYFYGPCNIVGSATYSPYKTIESYLQEKLNMEGIGYRVYNYGTEGLGSIFINWLYRIMDTPFTCGDIVIVFGSYWYFHVRNISNRFLPLQIHKADTPFFETDNIEKKCFFEPSVGHMNPVGYEIMAGYVKKIIDKDIRVLYKSPYKKTSFLSTCGITIDPKSRLGRVLERFPRVRRKSGTIGAVVLNDEDLSREYMYIVQESASMCEKLYVFMSTEKYSELNSDGIREFLNLKLKGEIEIVPYDMMERQTYAFDFKIGTFITGEVRHDFDPVDDTYTFVRYIAPRMGITKYFAYEETEKSFQHAYNMIRRDMLNDGGVEYIEVPRPRFE